MSRNYNRSQRERIIAKVKRIIKHCWSSPDLLDNPSIMGQLVENHMRVCSCDLCKKPRYNREEIKKNTRDELDNS